MNLCLASYAGYGACVRSAGHGGTHRDAFGYEFIPGVREGSAVAVESLPSRLDRVSYDARYTAGEGDDTVYAVAYICPDPSLSGESVDEANLRVLSDVEDAWRVTYRSWTWARYVVVLLPVDAATRVRESLSDYPVLDDMVWSEVECEWGESDDE